MRILLVLLLAAVACTQMKTKPIDESQISDVAKQKLDEARALIRVNKPKQAIEKLGELGDDKLTPVEKALKYNLKGVTLFNVGDVEKAILNFEVAEKYAPKDSQLHSQLQLNMGSGHFKLNQFTELKDRLRKIDRKQLTEAEVKKYAQLSLAYGNKVQDPQAIVSSSLLLVGDAKSTGDAAAAPVFDPMKEAFAKLTPGQKVELLEDFDDTKNYGVALLAQQEADDRYIAGDKSGAWDVIQWLRDEFGGDEAITKIVKDFELRLENSARISVNDIGLVLPLSGDKMSFGRMALSGVETGLKTLGFDENVKIHTKDSADSPAQGSQAVLELIREEKVAFIIGGLFSETAKAEYLEARKYGVLYISLSQINLPKDEKNHHLIEVQGSVESQIEALLSEDMIKKFGSRLGVVFPDNEAGKSYIDEIWRRATQKNLQITSVASFPKNTHDYRDTAQLFLGLKYPRERAEELNILEDVFALEKTTIRRVQTLPPVLDFDWVFMATYPSEATQLIPTLGYYDANRLKIVGGPSWVSKSLLKAQKNLGTLYFVGDAPKDLNEQILAKYQELNGKPAGLIEIFSLDAMKLGSEALRLAGAVGGRDEFDAKLKDAPLSGLTTQWEFKDGVWLKKMNALAITRGEIVKLFGESLQ
jgi:ABC-type branched-subunit amino acid transport system substrate-binding protein